MPVETKNKNQEINIQVHIYVFVPAGTDISVSSPSPSITFSGGTSVTMKLWLSDKSMICWGPGVARWLLESLGFRDSSVTE